MLSSLTLRHLIRDRNLGLTEHKIVRNLSGNFGGRRWKSVPFNGVYR